MHPDVLAAADTSYEIALDDGQARRRSRCTRRARGFGSGPCRLPVLPEHLRSLAGVRVPRCARAAVRGTAAPTTGSAPRCYLLRAAAWAVVGVLVIAGRLIRWWWVAEQTRLRSLAVISGDSREWRKLHKDAKNTPGPRPGPARRAFAVAVACVVLARFAPWWGWAVAGRRRCCRCWPGPGARRTSGSSAPAVDHAAVPRAQRRHRAARLLRGRARPPGQARPADHLRSADVPRRRRVPGAGRPAATARAWTTRSRPRPAIASGLDVTPVPGVHPPRPDQPPPAHAVGRRP